MTDLKSRLIRQIDMIGPIPLADYMHLCLAERSQGYYRTRQPFGSKGDFLTAPETSQMFGELIGIWMLQTWQQLGKPSPFCLAEFGPGSGTMMADILKAVQILPEFQQAARLMMVETSEALAATQQEALSGFKMDKKWCTSLKEVPPMPLIAIGNEFLDALPFRQYVKTTKGWHERVVTLDQNRELAFGIGNGAIDPGFLPANAETEPVGSIFEIAPAREAFTSELAQHLVEHRGAALLIDYGHGESGFGDTFQAIQNHQYADPLAEPGRADLTSHVDFAALRRTAALTNADVKPLKTQADFLLFMGLLERAGMLGRDGDQLAREKLQRQVERLAASDQMGELFKVFAMTGEPWCWLPSILRCRRKLTIDSALYVGSLSVLNAAMWNETRYSDQIRSA